MVNASNLGSTGSIMMGITEKGNETDFHVVAYTPDAHSSQKDLKNHVFFGNWIERRLSDILGKITGAQLSFNFFGTRQLISFLDEMNPDIVHLHNLHGSYLNLKMLFNWLEKKQIKVVWTFHDCWPLTGHCAHFSRIGCLKWKTVCEKCPQYKIYPSSFWDNSRLLFKQKKQMFSNYKYGTIVTPSKWLQSFLPDSFFKRWNSVVINNGINLSVFKKRDSKDLYEKYNIPCDKYIVLGVAYSWSNRKGLDVFEKLADQLDDKYVIVLVGLDENSSARISEKIVKVKRTQDKRTLADYYSWASVFVNPTREETLGLVNIESLACGTPVITFNTGGSPECVDESCGIVVEQNDIDGMKKAIIKICEETSILPQNCVSFSKKFDEDYITNLYLGLYKKIYSKDAGGNN